MADEMKIMRDADVTHSSKASLSSNSYTNAIPHRRCRRSGRLILPQRSLPQVTRSCSLG